MFLQICKKLNFPGEALPVLEEAYLSSREVPAFAEGCRGLLEADGELFRQAVAQIVEKTGLGRYTVHMVLQIHCLEALGQLYRDRGFTDERFWELAEMLQPQLLQTYKEHGVWGNETGIWPWVYHEWRCVNLGRLVFEPMRQWGQVAYKGVKEGDPVILIHIPGGSPLDMDAVMASLRQGYEYFKDQFPGGVVPFVTDTWLLYPPYMQSVFPAGGNVQKFAALFHILDQYVDESYENFPSVFGCPFHGADLSRMPQDTRLQRNLLAYLRAGNPMGCAHGIFLYGAQGIE